MSATIRLGESINAADYRRSAWEMGGLKILTVRPLVMLRPNVWLCAKELDCPARMEVLLVHQSAMYRVGYDDAPHQEDIEHPIVTLAKWVGNNRNEMRCQTIAIKFDSLDDAYAETDRLAAIANSQRSNGAILINNAYYRCSDVKSVDIVSMPLSWGCRVRLTGDRREDVWFDAPKGLSGDQLALQLTACEAKAHEYARKLMAQVAGAERGGE